MAEEIIIVQGNDTLAGEVAVSGAKKLRAQAHRRGAARPWGDDASQCPAHLGHRHHVRGGLRRLGAVVERDGHSLLVDTAAVAAWRLLTSSCRRCARASRCSGRSSDASGAPAWPCRAAAQIGARKIDMHLVASRPSASSSRWITDSSRPPRRGVCTARTSCSTPQRGRHGEPAHGVRRGRGPHGHRERRARARDRRPREHALVHGRARERRWGGHHRGGWRLARRSASLRAHDGGRSHRGRDVSGGRRADGEGPLAVRGIDPSYLRVRAHEALVHGMRRGRRERTG